MWSNVKLNEVNRAGTEKDKKKAMCEIKKKILKDELEDGNKFGIAPKECTYL
jgi:hypothetical protein